LAGNDSVRHNVKNELAMLKGQGNFLIFGHGNAELISVCGTEPTLMMSDTHLLVGKICYFLSCCTAKKLGPQAIKDGAIAFIGFRGLFNVIPGHEDDLAEFCLKGVTEFLIGNCDIKNRKSFF
jgi:hypothetical protein